MTAPLRRLVDRFGTELCLAVTAGAEVPEWLRAALPTLPEAMAASDAVASAVSRAGVDRTEAALLADRVGTLFDVVVLRDVDRLRAGGGVPARSARSGPLQRAAAAGGDGAGAARGGRPGDGTDRLRPIAASGVSSGRDDAVTAGDVPLGEG